MKVRAKSFGFHGGSKRRVGAIFDVSEKEFSGKWMEKMGENGKPVKEDGKEPVVQSPKEPEADGKSKGKRGKETDAKSSGDADVI